MIVASQLSSILSEIGKKGPCLFFSDSNSIKNWFKRWLMMKQKQSVGSHCHSEWRLSLRCFSFSEFWQWTDSLDIVGDSSETKSGISQSLYCAVCYRRQQQLLYVEHSSRTTLNQIGSMINWWEIIAMENATFNVQYKLMWNVNLIEGTNGLCLCSCARNYILFPSRFWLRSSGSRDSRLLASWRIELKSGQFCEVQR